MQRRSDAATMWGGLSVVLFWAFGLGVVLGIIAVVAGATALRGRPADAADPPARDALAGIAAGAVGIALGLLFLLSLIPPDTSGDPALTTALPGVREEVAG